jgi:DNA-binding winged helix-turn-helix (wHTH) protein
MKMKSKTRKSYIAGNLMLELGERFVERKGRKKKISKQQIDCGDLELVWNCV